MRPDDDFAGLAPALAEVVARSREGAAALAGALGTSPYDALLDGFEPGYFRTRFRLLRDGQNLAAQAYVFADPHGARPTRPSAMYLAQLLEGASEHELPARHIEYIRSFL